MSSAGSPAQRRDTSIEKTSEYEEFIANLQTFHNERGTTLDPYPKVGKKNVDLYKLYSKVTEEGGYDAVSDTKSNKLAWRRIGQDFRLGNANDPTLAFSLKTAYYKNLVAYEIRNFHNKEPPPPSILEEVTAKGGNVLNRTVDNFIKPATREEQRLANGVGSAHSDDETSPKQDSQAPEDGSAGRATRGLRQAPPPRQMYTGEINQPRMARGQPNGVFNSPTPSSTVPSAAYNAPVPQNLATYEPRPPPPLPLRPVMTPGNNYEQFKAEQRRVRDAKLSRSHNKMAELMNRGLILPGTGYSGPSIYSRTLLALQSGILEEQEYALHHLVKISHERGDKYRFDSFPGLAEALIKKLLEVGPLVLDVEWQIQYQGPEASEGEVIIDKATGSADVHQSVLMSRKRKRQDKLEPELFSRRLTLINEAGLVVRNMVMLQENAEFLSKFPMLRSLLIILLNLPSNPATSEIQRYGLELAEQLVGYFVPREDDQLYQSLLQFVDRNDRGVILSSLRSICRMGCYRRQTVRLVNISPKLIQKLSAWVIIEDEELRTATMDFLYQYTAVSENVDVLMRIASIDGFVKQLVRLLLHGAKPQETKEPSQPVEKEKPVENVQEIPIPRISSDHVDILLGYDEPERSTQWLRACFEEDAAGEITQIALWQAYQGSFQAFTSSRPLLPAKDFITNVSTTFARASAQVISGPSPKFVIKGIKARHTPVDPRGKKFMRCLWHVEGATEDAEGDANMSQDPAKPKACGEFARDPKAMWEHVVKAHLGVTKDADNKWDTTPSPDRTYTCAWAGCQHYASTSGVNAPAPAPTPFAVGMHLKTHLPDAPDRPGTSSRSKHNRADAAAPASTRTWPQRTTQTDERGDAAGLPLTAALVLRNVAAGIPRTPTAAAAGDAGRAIAERVFAPVRAGLFEVLAVNRSVERYVLRLLEVVDEACAPPRAEAEGDDDAAAAVADGVAA